VKKSVDLDIKKVEVVREKVVKVRVKKGCSDSEAQVQSQSHGRLVTCIS
jgi:hypothetical protein